MRLGIDLGAVFARIILADDDGRILERRADRHRGSPLSCLMRLLDGVAVDDRTAVGVTGKHSALLSDYLDVSYATPVSAELAVVRPQFPEARYILNVGGGSATLIQLGEDGSFLDYSTNSMCAAGTGSFLDLQAERLGLNLEEVGESFYNDDPPPIATRCSVFAKTDLIHRQQEGYSIPALWSGLCKSLTSTCLNTVLRGRSLDGPTVLTGGLTRNREVMRWMKQRYGEIIRTFSDAEFSGAMGAAMLATKKPSGFRAALEKIEESARHNTDMPRREPLVLRKSKFPSFEVAESYTDDQGNEVRISAWPEKQGEPTYVGVDIGSTSTKLLLIDHGGKALVDIYRRTEGDPIGATRKIFKALRAAAEKHGFPPTIAGMSTTGSGRKLVGKVFGADVIVNEITAHLRGALQVDPRVDTVFEIGGQDAKYIRAVDGRIRDSNMNYVCAAGTGSFVEEQAKRLGFSLEEIGKVVMGVSPPMTSDRCTVFMEQDVDLLVREGFSREECMAAVLYSVVKNYLNKVVGRRPYSKERVFFQGATARNKGLVAAFENLLGVEVVVSPYCHVMGSFGSALLVKDMMESSGKKTAFPGIEVADREVVVRSDTCEFCDNHCKITHGRLEGGAEEQSWGYLCGRDPDEKKARVNAAYELFRTRNRLLKQTAGAPAPEKPRGTVRFPMALTTYSHLPLWKTFFHSLGYQVKITTQTDDEIKATGGALAAADFCFPLKAALGQVKRALDDGVADGSGKSDYVLTPHMICPHVNEMTTNSFFCPYVQAMPSLARAALGAHHGATDRLLNPILDFRWSSRLQLNSLEETVGARLGLDRAAIAKAWDLAVATQRNFEEQLRQEGRKFLDGLKAEGRRGVVIVGRPYNTCDPGVNVGLPQKITQTGAAVIPIDMLPIDVGKLDPAFFNMYWAYGQKIMAAADYVRSQPNLFAIYLSNFACGPDSFLLSHFTEVMGDKPFLILELDEQGGDAGYMTRVEAFMDVLKAWNRELPPRKPLRKVAQADMEGKTVWIPPMHDYGPTIFAAAFKGFGVDARALPPEDRDAYELGRSVTRGSECLPCACTIGTFLKTLEKEGIRRDGRGNVFFMPAADGPCRFGQYGLLHRSVLDRMGWGGVEILSPSAFNSYHGLPQELRRILWRAILCSDILFKCGTKLRPYEREKGTTDRIIAAGIERVCRAFESGGDVDAAMRETIRELETVKHESFGTKPLIGVVGEIYVRCNPFCNSNVIRTIEALGGEAWLSPTSEWFLYTALMQRWIAGQHPLHLKQKLKALAKNAFLHRYEKQCYEIAGALLADRHEPDIEEIVEAGRRSVPQNFYGESILTLGRSRLFASRDKVGMVVNCAPFTCMPGSLTSALGQEIQESESAPIVSVFYDGEDLLNDRLAVYMNTLIAASARNGV
ncbi:MAG TPA: acyl-CoA dehydratase activase [Candidatus Brocadiia bacterium]|nr:acyl-CoA dehydratase activase [Candidatus Brocadiia bacterium]